MINHRTLLLALCFWLLPSLSVTQSVQYSCVKPCAVCIAEGEVGVSKQKNMPRVREYLKAVRINKYANWCAAFVVWCQKEAGLTPKITSAVARHHITHESIPAYRVLAGERVPRGWKVIWGYGEDWTGHIGFVTDDWVGKKGKTVEGNTSNNNTRAGGNVEKKNRRIEPAEHFRIIFFSP